MGHTSPSVAGRPGQRSACRALASPAQRRRIWPRTEPGRKHWGSWLLGLAVLIAIEVLVALTSDPPAPKLLAVAGTLPSPGQRAEHVPLLGNASGWGNGARLYVRPDSDVAI